MLLRCGRKEICFFRRLTRWELLIFGVAFLLLSDMKMFHKTFLEKSLWSSCFSFFDHLGFFASMIYDLFCSMSFMKIWYMKRNCWRRNFLGIAKVGVGSVATRAYHRQIRLTFVSWQPGEGSEKNIGHENNRCWSDFKKGFSIVGKLISEIEKYLKLKRFSVIFIYLRHWRVILEFFTLRKKNSKFSIIFVTSLLKFSFTRGRSKFLMRFKE